MSYSLPGATRHMGWVSLFSGGKDSSWALYRALQSGREVSSLLTVHPGDDSYMYHTPATELARLAADSLGIPLIEVDATDIDPPQSVDSSVQGDREIEPLEQALSNLDEDDPITGIIAGAVESQFQASRVEALAERLGVDTYTPLWQEDPDTLLTSMLEAGFEIRIIQVAAAGLDESWLGRTLDREALTELHTIREEYGIHLLGEGGEFETVVTDGPHMNRRIELRGTPVWEGNRGVFRISEAKLQEA